MGIYRVMNEEKNRDLMGPSGELSRDQRRKLRKKLKADLIKLQGLSSKLEARALQLLQSHPAPSRSNFSYGHFAEDEMPARNGCAHKEVSPQSNPGRSEQPSFATSNDASSPLGAERRGPKRALKTSEFYDKSVGKRKLPSSVRLNKKLAKSNGQGVQMVKRGSKEKSSQMSNEVKSHCRNILKKLMGNEDGWIFNEPVDAVKLGLSDYHAVIKKPMDLGTIKDNMEKQRYTSPIEFADDIRLTFSNAMSYNPPGNDVYQSAKILLAMFQKDWDVLRERLDKIEGGGEVVQTKSVGQFPLVAQVKSNGEVALPNQSALSSEKPGQAKAASVPAKQSKPSTGQPKGRMAKSKALLKHETQGKTKDWPRPGAPTKPNAAAKSEAFLKPKLSENPMAFTNAKAQATIKPKTPLKTNKAAKISVPEKVMSYKEKVRLQTILGQLPQRTLEELILRVKERHDIDMNQDGDEIEVDLDSFNDEILWELNHHANDYLNSQAESSKQPTWEEHAERNGKKQKVAGPGVPLPDLEKHVNSGNKSSSDSGASSDSDSRSSSTSDSDE